MLNRRRWSGRAIRAGVSGLLVVFALSLLAQRHRDRALYPAAPGAATVAVYVVDNGFHSDLVLPADRLRGREGPTGRAVATLPPTPFVTVGWGDAKFYADTSPESGRLLDGARALFAPDNPAVLRFEPLGRPPQQAYAAGVLRLDLSAAGFEALVRSLDGGFARPFAVAPPAPARPGDPRYFASRERFSLAHLCNHWTGQRLADAGVRTHPLLDTLAPGLTWDLAHGGGATRLR